MAINPVPVLRLYFNSADDPAKLWSVDHGEGTIERQYAVVVVKAASGMTRFDSAAIGSKDSPAGWLEFTHVFHVENGSVAIIEDAF